MEADIDIGRAAGTFPSALNTMSPPSSGMYSCTGSSSSNLPSSYNIMTAAETIGLDME